MGQSDGVMLYRRCADLTTPSPKQNSTPLPLRHFLSQPSNAAIFQQPLRNDIKPSQCRTYPIHTPKITTDKQWQYARYHPLVRRSLARRRSTLSHRRPRRYRLRQQRQSLYHPSHPAVYHPAVY